MSRGRWDPPEVEQPARVGDRVVLRSHQWAGEVGRVAEATTLSGTPALRIELDNGQGCYARPYQVQRLDGRRQ